MTRSAQVSFGVARRGTLQDPPEQVDRPEADVLDLRSGLVDLAHGFWREYEGCGWQTLESFELQPPFDPDRDPPSLLPSSSPLPVALSRLVFRLRYSSPRFLSSVAGTWLSPARRSTSTTSSKSAPSEQVSRPDVSS